MKRMCFKKLPKVLAIQLKRFDYDWERYKLFAIFSFYFVIHLFDNYVINTSLVLAHENEAAAPRTHW